MKVLVIAGILLVNSITQSSLFPFIKVAGVAPDTLMIITISFALQTGSITGAIVGFSGGLIQDIMFADVVGVNAVIYMLIGFLAGLIYDRVFIDKIFFPILFVFMGTMVKGVLKLVYLFFRRAEMSFGFGLQSITLPEAVYTIIFTPLIFYLLYLLNEKKFMNKKWYFRRD